MENNPTPLQQLQEHIVSLAPVVHWLEQHPELSDATMSWSLRDTLQLYVSAFEGDTAERFAAAVRALKDGAPIGAVRRNDDDLSTRFERDFGAITVIVYTSRAAVCEKVVVGTETVEVPDPDAPKVTVERELVEWRCRPVLAAHEAESAVTS